MVHLQPPAWHRSDLAKLSAAGQTLHATFSPRDNSLATFVSTNQPSTSKRGSSAAAHEADIYLSTLGRIPSQLRRDFISDTYITFVKFARYVRELQERGTFSLHDSDVFTAFSNVVDDYLVVITAHTEALEKQQKESTAQSLYHYQTIYSSLSLMQTIYLPASGSRNGVVGEELLDWLNRTYFAPRTEEGTALNLISEPWSEANFWPYITTAVLRGLSDVAVVFLVKLESQHPSPFLQHLASVLIPIIKTHPRSPQFGTDNDFFSAWRQWREHVMLVRREFDGLAPQEGRNSWREPLDDIINILEGDSEALARACKDSEAGWRELVCLWGVWLRPGLRRDDIATLIPDILAVAPADVTIPEEALHLALLENNVGRVIEVANKVDIWLVAHMIDMLAPLNLLDDMKELETTVAVRDYLVLSYAEYLRGDPHLWRITVDYMYTCGSVGEQMGDQVLLTVPLQNFASQSGDIQMLNSTFSTASHNTVISAVDTLSEICLEHRREGVRRRICRNAARIFLEQGEFGLAISYHLSAEDYAGIGRCANYLLDEYVDHGPKNFLNKVDQIAVGLQYPENMGENAVYIYRLEFVQRYAEFHRLALSGNLVAAAEYVVDMFATAQVPTAWIAVLLADAARLVDSGELLFRADEIMDLMGRLEILQSNVDHGPSAEYLGVLTRIEADENRGSDQQRLDAVRLSLARYFARCTHHVGGRGVILDGTPLLA